MTLIPLALVPMANDVSDFLAPSQSLGLGAVLLAGALLLLFSQFGKRLTRLGYDAMFTNWRLGLLGLTGIVLSMASGWTTWDGMRNFTREPVLSAMVTFGIQGVMLIVAWLIGESFATGMSHRRRGDKTDAPTALRIVQPIASSLAGILLFTAIGIFIYSTFFALPSSPAANAGAPGGMWWDHWRDNLLIATPVVLLVALLVINAGSDVLEDYTQSLRIMIRSAVLWVMFLACMATSVFFSFDSLFSTIFPKEERQRAADLRAQNQVAGIVNDIASIAARRHMIAQKDLFASDAWQSYSDELDKVEHLAAGAEDDIRSFQEEKMRTEQAALSRLQEERSSAQSQQVSLGQRKTQLNADVSRLKEQVAGLAPEVQRLKSESFAKDREIIAKRAEAEGEAGGIGVTSKIGRGPKYREIKQALDRLLEEHKNINLQLRAYEQRLKTARDRLTRSETELTQTDGEIAKLTGRATTASKMIATREGTVEARPHFDALSGVQQLTAARDSFRQQPTAAHFEKLQGLCTTIVSAMQNNPPLAARSAALTCDAGRLAESTQVLFAVNQGIAALKAQCIGGDKLPTGGADSLFRFARQCVQDARLPGDDTALLRQKINYAELNRDDKAHRFVVTANAFQDGNKLAYLALAIAIAIDTLVFMSGLFGANAVRSPLSDVPNHKGRSARQLDDVVENALLPDKFDNAMHALEVIHPVSHGRSVDALGPGWTHEAIIEPDEARTHLRVLKVLNAGATIGAVRRDGDTPHRYFIRSELVEFLNQVAKNAFERDKDRVKHAELRKILTVALQPYVSDHADIVLSHMHPISEKSGFTSEIFMSQVHDDDVPLVQRALNAGSTLDFVQRDDRKQERDRFYIHRDFYRVLATLSAEHQKHGRRLAFGQHQITAASAAVNGGSLTDTQDLIASDTVPASHQITDQTQAPDSAGGAAHGGRRSGPPERHSTDPDAYAGVKPVRDPSPSHDPAASAENRAVALRRTYLDRLFESLAVPIRPYLALSHDALQSAQASGRTFTARVRDLALLERRLRDCDRLMRGRLERGTQQLAQSTDSDIGALQADLLREAREEIEQNWAIIMLLPNGPYEGLVDTMVREYEADAAAGNLSDDNMALLAKARGLLATLATNPRSNRHDWLRLDHELGLERELGLDREQGTGLVGPPDVRTDRRRQRCL